MVLSIITSLIREVTTAVSALLLYYKALWAILVTNVGYDDLRKLLRAPRVPFWSKYDKTAMGDMTAEEELRLFTAVHMYSISLMFALWDKPHYRAESLQEDLINNFRNIALPGTGVPISLVCSHKRIAQLYFALLHPLVVLVEAFVLWRSNSHSLDRSLSTIFRRELLAPEHWFALWRINSILVAAHHKESQRKVQNQYRFENKWSLLELALKDRLRPTWAPKFQLTPFLDEPKEIVCKHKNIEGGMGIHVFKNAAHGGEWILQERLYNAPEIQRLLPEGAPLSTFRVITMADPTADTFEDRHVAMTTVFRAGRAGKTTDHSSVLFAVDPADLTIQEGRVFSNWYQVGRMGFSNLVSKRGLRRHPDTFKELSGIHLPCADKAKQMCIEAHRRLMPDVPAIGWDVAIAQGLGPVLLEANLSCNFFGGMYDRQRYLKIVDTYFANGCLGTPKMADDDGVEGSSTAGLSSIQSEMLSPKA